MSAAKSEEGRPHPEVTVVIPAYNERDGIARTVREINSVLSGAGIAFEVIVVDDGSTDGTPEAAEAEACRVIRAHRNSGYGASLKRGIAAAHSDRIAIIDADGTYPATALPELVRRSRTVDMVVGARTGQNVNIPLQRRPAKAFITWLAGYLCGRHIPDLNSGLRIFRRKHALRFARILPAGFSFTTTITLALLCNDYAVDYVSIDYHKRIGTSKIRARHAYDFTLLILRCIVLFNPLKVFLPVGAVLAILGFAKFIYDCMKENLSESAVMCILGAIIVWCVGLLADQNTRLGLDPRAWDEED